MLTAALLLAAMAAGSPDLLELAAHRHAALASYRLTLRSTHGGGTETLRYSYRKPGFVRMDLQQPHRGAVLIYSPESGRVRVWPFGVGRFPELSLSPGNRLIASARGQRIDRSDIGALLANVAALRQHGTLERLGNETLQGWPVERLRVHGNDAARPDGIASYELWLDAATLLPRRVISRDRAGQPIEQVEMQDFEADPALPADWFDPQP